MLTYRPRFGIERHRLARRKRIERRKTLAMILILGSACIAQPFAIAANIASEGSVQPGSVFIVPMAAFAYWIICKIIERREEEAER